ncbi:MAG: iron-sulfur cluster biosynthesis transcriptional regulator SufR [Microcoleus sp. PH2017_10_PVI_O_A]|uniref:iron-sulfur cluster biosynthesis transcriptional regulator SufR n=1 Tax=unclassified Microcoleus TaxID=2642155 RepID=UPI001DA361B3|nr:MULTISPECIES: iron-sulfur cluster biosynthesis transcriptional regulator SufR [unclassified Microcoleus]TAE86194.1 MAG: iron-sulfur cluster biosynthesis transcriptional regulator SufR [Oscillatoriales cyanobacterium]MCC3410062.1 iron-sulfur cluster biosynthesis transcriptional regulator SufR [Microcoleus sp. PH2017_10_PVI_O_A]MCC3464325.1 iron-sulfur cluster biosynthesis transcriptional regulator SufR [Microcoleus sp. PH2017_11_PCY_U_A]MCC3482667.1 iron-sulfur cluster biosynthesis transcript
MMQTQQTSTKQDILQYLLKGGQGTALELADSLEISPQAIRRHLKDLEGEGLIQYQSVQAGMGRPQHIYELTSLGRDRFPNRYGDFAVSFLDTLAETVGREQVITILQKQWERKAMEYRRLVGTGSLQERVTKLVELRRDEGYMAECYPVESVGVEMCGDVKGDRFVFMEHNCAISNVAETFPSVCGNELEMFAAVLPDCTVERTHWIIDGEHRCGYSIAKKEVRQRIL